MSLRRVVAAPFKRTGGTTVSESEFVVALSLHHDWFSPEQAKRVLECGCADGLVSVSDGEVEARFDPSSVEVPTGFTPDESVLTSRSIFEQILDRLIEHGIDKRDAVAGINRLQREYGVTVDAAAALFAASESVDISDELEHMRPISADAA